MGLLLTITAYILLLALAIPSIIVGTIVSLFQHQGNAYYMNMAIGIDHLGNVICQHLFNLVLIKKTGYKFGNIESSISRVLGVNKKAGTCTTTGLLLCKILNSIDKNHVEKSIYL